MKIALPSAALAAALVACSANAAAPGEEASTAETFLCMAEPDADVTLRLADLDYSCYVERLGPVGTGAGSEIVLDVLWHGEQYGADFSDLATCNAMAAGALAATDGSVHAKRHDFTASQFHQVLLKTKLTFDSGLEVETTKCRLSGS